MFNDGRGEGKLSEFSREGFNVLDDREMAHRGPSAVWNNNGCMETCRGCWMQEDQLDEQEKLGPTSPVWGVYGFLAKGFVFCRASARWSRWFGRTEMPFG